MTYNNLGHGSTGVSIDNSSSKPSISSNGVAKACKITAIIIFILAFIGTCMLSRETDYSSYYSYSYSKFNWETAFTYWTCSFLFCLFLFALGEIVNQQAIANDNTNTLIQQNEKIIKALTDNKIMAQTYTNSYSFDDLPDL